MSFEKIYYENEDIWAVENFSAADRQRVADMAAKVPQSVKTLLDVGCGNGIFLKYLSDTDAGRFTRLCGTDRSTTALCCVQAEKVQASIDNLPFGQDEFDLVSCMEVLEHLPQKTYLDALQELSRIARRYILISVPYNENLHLAYTVCAECCCRFNPNYHLRCFDENKMQHMFENHGFKCLDIFHLHPEKVIPPNLEVALRFLGIIKRTVLGQGRPAMASRAVCPACGCSPRNTLAAVAEPPQTKGIEATLRSALLVSSGWRWLGALYERV